MTHPDTGEKATMSESIDRTEVARAFAQHRFDKAIPHLARDVSWTILGYMVLEGADAVARTCRDTAGSLHDTVVVWERCRTVTEDDTVVAVHRNASGCGDCRRCEEVCPDGLPLDRIGVQDCTGCLYCWWACPKDAITLEGDPGFLARHAERYKRAIERL